MPNSNGLVEIKDFEFSPDPKRFRMYKDDEFIFEAMPVIPIGLLDRLKNLRKITADSDDSAEMVLDFFDQVLLPGSSIELRKRATEPSKFPFGINHMQPIMEWLMEAYGMRPTQPSSDFSSGSVTEQSSMSLTDGAPVEESTPGGSLPTVA
jgi:hypothetical protein